MLKAYYGSRKLFEKFDSKMMEGAELGYVFYSSRDLAKNNSGENGFIYEVDLHLKRFISDGRITITGEEIGQLLDHLQLGVKDYNQLGIGVFREGKNTRDRVIKGLLSNKLSDVELLNSIIKVADKQKVMDYCHEQFKMDAVHIPNQDNTTEYVVLNKQNIKIKHVEQLKGYVVDSDYVYLNDKYKLDYTRFSNQVYYMDLGEELGPRPGIILYQNLKTDTALVLPFSSSQNRFYHNDPSTGRPKYLEHVFVPEMKGLALCERIYPCKVDDIKGKWLGENIYLSDQTMLNIKEKIAQVIKLNSGIDINIGDVVIFQDRVTGNEVTGVIEQYKLSSIPGQEMNPMYNIKTLNGELILRKKFDITSDLKMHSKIPVDKLSSLLLENNLTKPVKI